MMSIDKQVFTKNADIWAVIKYSNRFSVSEVDGLLIIKDKIKTVKKFAISLKNSKFDISKTEVFLDYDSAVKHAEIKKQRMARALELDAERIMTEMNRIQNLSVISHDSEKKENWVHISGDKPSDMGDEVTIL